MSDKAIDSILKIDTEKHRVERIVMSIYHNVLYEYTAHANRDEIMNGLYRFFTESDFTLINKIQLRQYEEMEKLIIQTSPLPPIFKE